MKIMKKIFLSVVILFGLFFYSSNALASNNLSTNFYANNDELTITVKNNSNIEVSDIEYDLKLPNNYNAEFISNPNFKLLPNQETSFKVKISQLDNNLSTGEVKTNSFQISEKNLSNTGLHSEVSILLCIILLLMVGTLFYFKHKKILIILLTIGLGTQTFSSYSLANNKIKQLESFNENLVLLNNNITVSLDIYYSIENNTNNNVDYSNNSNEYNKVINKIPKEVLVSGYAYSAKTNSVLENKELKLFDGNNEIATFTTSYDGYFFTYIVQDKTYTIKGEDFEATVVAKINGEYEYNEVIGRLTLGRIQEDDNTSIKIKPSVAFINDDIEYKVEDRTVVIDGEHKLKSGDKIVLSPNYNYPTGFAFFINNVSIIEGKTKIDVTPITKFSDAVDDLKYNEEVDITNMEFIPAEGVTLLTSNSELDSKNRSVEGSLTVGKKLMLDDKSEINLEGKINYDFSISEKRVLIKPSLSIGYVGNIIPEREYKHEKKLGTFGWITVAGISSPIDVYLVIDINGNADLKYEYKNTTSLEIGYNNGKVFNFDNNSEYNLSFDLEGVVKIGPNFSFPATTLFKTIKIFTIDIFLGPIFEGNLEGKLSYVNKTLESEITGEIRGDLGIISEIKLDVLEKFGIDPIYFENKVNLFKYPEDKYNKNDDINYEEAQKTTEKFMDRFNIDTREDYNMYLFANTYKGSIMEVIGLNKNNFRIMKTKLSKVIDHYNEISQEIYNENDLIEEIKNTKNWNYIETDVDFYSAEGRKIIENSVSGSLYYFKTNKVYISISDGLGGAFPYPKVSDKTKWIVGKDSITIPIVENNNENIIKGTILLKKNQKNYSGGEKRSLYYIESVKIN